MNSHASAPPMHLLLVRVRGCLYLCTGSVEIVACVAWRRGHLPSRLLLRVRCWGLRLQVSRVIESYFSYTGLHSPQITPCRVLSRLLQLSLQRRLQLSAVVIVSLEYTIRIGNQIRQMRMWFARHYLWPPLHFLRLPNGVRCTFTITVHCSILSLYATRDRAGHALRISHTNWRTLKGSV